MRLNVMIEFRDALKIGERTHTTHDHAHRTSRMLCVEVGSSVGEKAASSRRVDEVSARENLGKLMRKLSNCKQ